MIYTINDKFETCHVTSIGYDRVEKHQQPGITTTTDWYSMGYYANQLSQLPENAKLTIYCKLHYQEYFI